MKTISSASWLRFLWPVLVTALAALPSATAFTVESIKVPSPSMKRSIPALVIKPKSATDSAKPVPVLYLLHGYGDDEMGWSTSTPIGELADQYNVQVVCPDGETSWYFDSPEKPELKFETFVAKELVNFVDDHYATIPSRAGRAIAGLSMGGHGALFLGIRHREVFGAAVGMSGGVDFRPFPENWELKNVLGAIEEHPERWDELNVINQAKALKDGELAISIDCGVDDFFIEVNRALHRELLAQKVGHDYTERPGGHDWSYWANSIQYQMLFVSNFFKAASSAAPAAP